MIYINKAIVSLVLIGINSYFNFSSNWSYLIPGILNGGLAIIISYLFYIGFLILSPYDIVLN